MLSSLGKMMIVAAILVAFFIGLAGTVYLSLRSPEVQVPEIVGKNRYDGESTLEEAGLNVRVRATRFKAGTQPNTVIDQSPRAGDIVKAGQTIAVVLSREPREGESVGLFDEAGNEGIRQDAPSEVTTPNAIASPANVNANRNANSSGSQNQNQRNKNANKSTANKNSNKNRNNQNLSNRNANRAAANTNLNRANANTNRNANAGNRNATPVRPPVVVPDANRRPPATTP